MSGRKFARKKISSINQTSVPNPLQPRRLKIPPHLTQSDTQQQEKRSIPEQLEKASKFGYNGLDLPVDVSTTSPPSVQNQLVTGELDNTLQPQPVPETEVASSPENNPEQQALSTPDSGASQAQEQAISVEELSEQQELDSQKTDDTIQQQDIPDAEPEVMAKPETETAQPQEEKSPLQAQLDKASHFNHNFLEIPVNAAGKSSPLVQRMPTLDRLDHQDELQTVERANPVLNGLHLLKAQTGVQTKKTTPDGITEPEESPETLEDAETENGTVTNQNGKRAAGENKPVTRVVKTNTDSEAGEKSADPKNEGKDQTVNPDVASANIQTANQEAQQAVEAVTQKEPAQTKPTVTEQGTETKKDNTPAGTATAKGSDQEGKAEGKGSAPEKTPTGKGTVEPEAVAKVTTQTEKVAQKQAEATTAVTQTQTQMAAAASTSQQLANTGLAFAAPEIKPTFVTTEEGISALAPKKILGSAGNGKVIYQTDNPQESLAAAEQGISVQPVPDAQVAQSTEKQRLQAEAAIAQFMASGSERIATISSLGQTIAPRIQASRGQAIASVDTAISQNQAAITNAITQARTQVQSQGQAAKNQVTGQHQATVAAIKSSTTAARDRLQSSYQASLNQLTQIESGMAGKIAQPFTQAANDFRAAGMKVGQEAIQVGENYKSQFQGESPPEPSNFVTEFLESFDRDTYVQNWRQAKIKAAGDVAENYRAGLVQNANEKAGELSTSQSEVVKGMREVVTTTRNDLQVKYTAALQELTQSEQSALQMATETLNGQLQGIDQNLTSTLGSLDQMQATQLAQLNSLGQQQKLGINANAEQVTAALQEGVNQATTSLQGAFQQFADQAQGMETPNLQVVKSVIAEAQGQLDGMMASTQTSLETGISNSEQGIVQQAQGMLGSINTVGQQAATSSAAVSEEFNTSIAQEVQSATQAFTQLQTGHTTAVNGSAEKTVGEFKNFTTGVQQKLDGVIQNLTGKLTESVTQLENGLRGSLKGSDQNPSIQKAIEDKAKEAADQVQPAWKSVVKVLIDIVITVAVTVAIAALAASGVGLVAAIGLAALIGAGGALLKQGANDLIDGKMSSWQTYATQAGFGAVGGVLQLVGIRGADKAAGLLTNTIAKTGAKFGLESAGEMGADITQRLAAGEQFSLAMVGVSFGTSLLGNAGGEAISSGFGKLGTKLGIDQIDNVALKTGGEFVTDTIGETATDVTSQVVFEGKDLSWQTVGESAGTSAFGNVVGRGANRAYGDRLRNLGGGAPTSTNVPNLDQSLPPVADISTPTPIIDPNTNQPIGQTPVSTPIIDPNTNQPIGQTPVPTPIIDPNTNQPIGQIPVSTPIIDPNTNQPVGQIPVSTPIIDPNTNQPVGQIPVSTPIIDANTNQPIGQTPTPTPIIDANTNQPIGQTPSTPNQDHPQVPKNSDSNSNINSPDRAQAKLQEIKDFKKLRQMVEQGELGNPETARQTLQEARNQIIDSVLNGDGGVQKILAQRYPNITIEFKDLGSKGFGSDRDITVKVTGGKDANENARASVEGVREAYKQLRELGFEPDKALDANFYTELHEGNITPTSKAEATQILHDQSVTSLAEMRMNMSPEQWQAYKQQQLESLGLGKPAEGVQDSSQVEARDRLQQQLEAAEALATRLQDQSKPKEQLLEERQAALLEALERNASPREIRQLMAEVKLLEPDAYGTRAAVEGVVDYQQAMKGDKGDGYWDIYTGRADKLPDQAHERFAVLSQEASASLAKMYSHSHGETGNSVSDVLAMAKYLGRIDHAHFEAGLSTSNNPVIDTMHQLMATKANGGSPADAIGVLREWAQANNLSDLTDQQIQDAWVGEAQKLGQDLVVKLRSSEQMAHVFAPQDISDSGDSGSESSTPLETGDTLTDATTTPDQTHSDETPNQTAIETLPDSLEKSKDADESNNRLDSTETQDTNRDRSLNADLEQTLTAALPNDLQGKVAINVDPDLPSNTVRVHYDVDSNGLVTNVHMRVGPNASAVDIQLHTQTVRLMQRYSGFSGRIRILKERIQNWISKNGTPPVGSRAWEAKLEVEKLPRIIDERLNRLSEDNLDADAQANLQADIENLQQQLAQHQQTLNEMETDPGVGFVAAKGRTITQGLDPALVGRAKQIEQDIYKQLEPQLEGVRGNARRELKEELQIRARKEALVRARDELFPGAKMLPQGEPAVKQVDPNTDFPFGFYNREDFETFSQQLRQQFESALDGLVPTLDNLADRRLLAQHGLETQNGSDTVARIKSEMRFTLEGSSLTGRSYDRVRHTGHTGEPFDVGRISDYDIAIVSPTLFNVATRLMFVTTAGGSPPRTGPSALTSADLTKLGLTGVATQAQALITNLTKLGHPVNFKIYSGEGLDPSKLNLPLP